VKSDERAPIFVGDNGSDQADDALALAELLREAMGGPIVRASISPGESDPADGLRELAVEHRAQLLVVGSSHRGPVGRIFPGSVGRKLLHGAPCPLAVAPRGFAEGAHALAVIAVGFDGTDGADHAVRAAADLALEAGASLRVIAVLDTMGLMYLGPERPTVMKTLRTELTKRVDELLESLPAELHCEARLLSGPVPRTLLNEMADGVDLLVVGSRASGPIGSVLIGSVSSELAESSPVPVLIVPRRAPDQAAGESSQRSMSDADEAAGRSVRSGKWRDAETSASSSNT
jgi:nucleotide-binding universal stress UspA family protein